MMRDIIRKKRAAIICGMVVIGILALYLAAFVYSYSFVGTMYGGIVAVLVLIIFVLLGVAVITGIVIALCQRLKELEGGEEEDAKKY